MNGHKIDPVLRLPSVSRLLTMHLWAPFTLLTVTVAALENPHRKAWKQEAAKIFPKRDAQHVQTSYQYLNKQTERE